MRNHAERTELVAAGLRPHKSLKRCRPHLRITIGVVALEALGDRLAASASPLQAHFHARTAAGEDVLHEAGHAVQLSRADDQIDPRGPPADEFLIFLGHTAQHPHDEAGPLLLLGTDPAKSGIDFVLGMLPDTAGVVEDGIGVGRRGSKLPSLPAQGGDDELAVEHIHLAADRFNPEPFCHAPDSSLPAAKRTRLRVMHAGDPAPIGPHSLIRHGPAAP